MVCLLELVEQAFQGKPQPNSALGTKYRTPLPILTHQSNPASSPAEEFPRPCRLTGSQLCKESINSRTWRNVTTRKTSQRVLTFYIVFSTPSVSSGQLQMTEMVPLFRTGDDVIALKESLPYSDPDPDPDADESIRSRPREADEYARWNGLTVDTFLDDPWEEATAPVDNGEDIISATLDHYLEPGCLFELDEDLQECLFRAIIPTPEQPDLSAGSLRLIQEACKTSKEHEVWALMEELCFLETSEQKRLKLEPPLLATDHDRDCRRVAHKLKALAQAPVSSHGLSPIPTEAGSGEGLEFSDAEKKGDAELMEAFGKETLEVTRESLLFLVESLRTEWTDGDRQDLFESVSTYKGVWAPTPPISCQASKRTKTNSNQAKAEGAPDTTPEPPNAPITGLLHPHRRRLRGPRTL